MKFINFGCWNKGKCKMNSLDNPVSAIMQHINNDVLNSLETPNPYNFIVVSGDNYYPEKFNKIKIFKEKDLSSGFDCLHQIPIEKYVIFEIMNMVINIIVMIQLIMFL